MACREFLEFLMSYLDGELSAIARRRFETHLVECLACVNCLATYRETITSAVSMPGRSTPGGRTGGARAGRSRGSERSHDMMEPWQSSRWTP